MSILERRALLGGKTGILPPGYTRVAYVQSTGTQAISLDEPYHSNYSFRLSFKDLVVQAGRDIYGTRYSSNGDTFMIGLFSVNGHVAFGYSPDVGSRGITYRIIDNLAENDVLRGEYTVSQSEYQSSNNSILLRCVGNDVNFEQRVTYKSLNSGNNVGLFCRYEWYASLGLVGKASVKITHFDYLDQDGNAVYDFVPAIRDSDGKVGFYNLGERVCPQTGTSFWVNSSSGADFIAGPPV